MPYSVTLRVGGSYAASGWRWVVPGTPSFIARVEDDDTGAPVTNAAGVRFYVEFSDGRPPTTISGTPRDTAGEWGAAVTVMGGTTLRVQALVTAPQVQSDIAEIALVLGIIPARSPDTVLVTSDGEILADGELRYYSAARLDELPEMTSLDGATLPGVEADGRSARLPVDTLGAYARDQAEVVTEPLTGRVITLEASTVTLAQRLAALEYAPPAVSGLTASPAVAEIGATLTSVTLTVTRNRPDLPAVISGAEAGVIPPGQFSLTLAGSWTADATWTATVTDPAPPPGLPASGSRSVTLPFRLRRYWGLTASATPDDAAIRALASELATVSSGRRSATLSPAGQYVVYAQPAAWPIADSVVVGGFATTAFTDTLRDLVSPTGHAEPYRIRVLTYPLTGTNLEILF